MNKIYQIIIAFLSGALLIAIYAIKQAKPTIVTDSYVEQLEQNIKKLKQSGENNTQNVTHTVDLSSESNKKKKFLGIFKRRNKSAQNK